MLFLRTRGQYDTHTREGARLLNNQCIFTVSLANTIVYAHAGVCVRAPSKRQRRKKHTHTQRYPKLNAIYALHWIICRAEVCELAGNTKKKRKPTTLTNQRAQARTDTQTSNYGCKNY